VATYLSDLGGRVAVRGYILLPRLQTYVRRAETMGGSKETRVVARTGEGLRTKMEACGHELVADEPKSLDEEVY
jgi:hypothetical protein